MPISISLLRALVVAGASAGAIVDAVEAVVIEDEARTVAQRESARAELKQQRAADRDRKRLQRQREKSSHSVGSLRTPVPVTRDLSQSVRDVTRDICDTPIPLPFPPTPSLTNPLTPLDDVDVRARGFSELAGRLADQAMEILGVDRVDRPRLWHGFEADLERKLAACGWRADLILAAARRVAASFAKRTGEKHPESFGYLTKPIENEHLRYQRELALVTTVAPVDPAAIDRARAAQLWVHGDDERFKAWHEHFIAQRGRGLPKDGKGGWNVPSDWPPDHPRASEAAA